MGKRRRRHRGTHVNGVVQSGQVAHTAVPVEAPPSPQPSPARFAGGEGDERAERGPQVVIREATGADAVAIFAFLTRVAPATGRMRATLDEAKALAEIDRVLSVPGYGFALVAEVDGA